MGDTAGGAGTEDEVAARYVLDEEEVARLEQAILAGGHARVVIDLSAVGRCTGLGAWSLARLQSRARARGTFVRVRSLSPAVYETLDQTGLDAVLLVEDYIPSTERLSMTIGALVAQASTVSSDDEGMTSTSLAATTSTDDRAEASTKLSSVRDVRSSASTDDRPPAEFADRRSVGSLRRSVRFYATRSSRLDRSSHPTPFLLFEAAEMGPDRRRRGGLLRRRGTYEDVGFARLDPSSKLMPVAPRWTVVLDSPAKLVRLQLADVDLFAVPEEQVPEVWRLAAAEWGTCHVVAGIGLELERDHPFLASKLSMELGACFGGVVLVDLVVD